MPQRTEYRPPTPEKMRNGPKEHTIWYDTLSLPDDATVESEVLPTIDTSPIDAAYAPNRSVETGFLNRGDARRGIVAMEILGTPRSRQPWRPRV